MFSHLRVVFPSDNQIGQYTLTNANPEHATLVDKDAVATIHSTIRSSFHSSVYRATINGETFVLKFSVHGRHNVPVNHPSLPDLLDEADAYQTKLSALQGTVVPLFYGLFKGQDNFRKEIACGVLEDCGESVKTDFLDLPRPDRMTILKLLGELHLLGWHTPDFAERNVVHRPGLGYRLIDFDQLVPHVCTYARDLHEYLRIPKVDVIGCQKIAAHGRDMLIWIPGGYPCAHIGPVKVARDYFPDQQIIDELLPGPSTDSDVMLNPEDIMLNSADIMLTSADITLNSADIMLNSAILMKWLRQYRREMDNGTAVSVKEYKKTLPDLMEPPRHPKANYPGPAASATINCLIDFATKCQPAPRRAGDYRKANRAREAAEAAAREAYRRDVLKMPRPLDRWLVSVARSPDPSFLSDYTMTGGSFSATQAPDNGTIFKDEETYTLYITAYLPDGTGCPWYLQESPRAVLERFTGIDTDKTAPDWVNWQSPTLEFYQPTALFADLFVRVAMWEHNMSQVEAWPTPGTDPSTPRKQQMATNSRSHKRDVANPSHAYPPYDTMMSPTRGRATERTQRQKRIAQSFLNLLLVPVQQISALTLLSMPVTALVASRCHQWKPGSFRAAVASAATVAVPNRSPSTQRGALAAPRNVNVGRTHAAVTRNIHRVGSLTPAPPIRSSSSLPPNSSQLHSGTVFERAPSESPSSGDFQPDDRDTDAQTSDSVRLDEYSHARGSPGLLVHSTSSNLHGCPPEARTSNLSRGMDPQPDAPPTAILSGPGRFTSTPTAPLPTDAHLPVPIDYTIPNPALSAVPSIALSAALSTAPATLAAAPSVALSAAPSATSSATPSAPIRSSSTFRTRSAPSIIRDAESRGQEHELRRSTDTFEPIADDDWEHEDRGHEDDPAETDVGDRDNQPPPAASSNKDTDDSFDPFQYSPAPVRAPPTPQEVHPNLLLVVSLAFRSAGSPINPPMVTTLPTVIAQLDAESSFKVYPVCPTCLKVYPVTTPYDHTCDRCAHPLYHPPPPRTEKHRRNTAAETRRPYLQYPSKSIEEQLATILALPGMEREMESWRNKQRVPGKYVDMFDGDICKTIPGPDGSPFFFPDTEAIVPGELRIGVSLGADWFSYLRSLISASHTSCPISLSIVNLATYLRTANLMLAGIIPGPKEPNPDEVQEFLKVLVNELLRLWKDGVIIITPSYPNGRLVRVILVCVVCDKPAAHKVGGFASHSHHFFCTRCWVEQDLKATSASFESNGFRKRTNAEQRRYQAEYKTLSTKAARAQFVKDYATRWCELSRLPYFDLCRMIVVDPMHNLFLGVVKTHFYHIWIQQKVLRKTKELRRFHAILSELSMPAKLGRLPSLIGEPAGGSLTADQWLVFATVVAPIAIPQVWQDYQSENSSEVIPNRTAMISALIEEKRKAAAVAREKAAAARRAVEHMSAGDSSTHQRPQRNRRPTARAMEMDVDPEDNGDNEAVEDDDDVYAPEDRGDSDPEGQRQYTRPKKRRRKAKDRTVDEEQDSATPSHLHQDDPGNFLKLCTALKILVSREITDREIDEADTLLREYCQELVKVKHEFLESQ
ncbi:hypothetical protein PLICRDRAFT_31629 [Plicaturopsis crispa FD-325 SS-3]|nr:hypothetical protein PLICRDRAFT_31629 [Plicaturopsis crispa FD-325 SS-3]